jgi:putative tricarboxylic transport membrane protein
MNFKGWIVYWLAAGLLATSLANSAGAQDQYPSKTIVFTSHSAPGGGTDLMGRQLIEALKAQNIVAVIENRPGGSGSINLSYLASRPGDGYTLGTASRSHLIARYMANLPLSFADFKPVARVVTEEYAIVARADSPWKSIHEVIKALKDTPGTVKIGGGAIGSPDSLIAFGIFKALGVAPAYVPYETSPEIAVGLLGDQLQLAVLNPPEARAQLESGQFKVLATAGEGRSPHFSDAPTLKEIGIDVTAAQWLGVWAPKSTPDELVAKAADFVRVAIREQSFQDFIEKNMMIEAYLGPKDFYKNMEADDKVIAQLIEELGLKDKKD